MKWTCIWIAGVSEDSDFVDSSDINYPIQQTPTNFHHVNSSASQFAGINHTARKTNSDIIQNESDHFEANHFGYSENQFDYNNSDYYKNDMQPTRIKQYNDSSDPLSYNSRPRRALPKIDDK